MNNPFLESADFRSDYESLWTDFAKEQVHIWRIRTELGEGGNLDQKVLQDVPLPASTISQIKRLEAEQLKSRQEDYLREKEFLRRVIKQAEEHIGVLSESLKREEEGVQADMQDLQRVTDLFGKGAVAITRITDARRAVLWSSTLKLQTNAQWMSQKKQREEVSRQLERLGDQRRMDLLRELQDAGVRLSQISARLQGVGGKLQYPGRVRSQLVRGGGGKPQVASLERERTAGNALSQRKISSFSRVTWSRLLCELSKASSCRRSKVALWAALLPTFGLGTAAFAEGARQALSKLPS